MKQINSIVAAVDGESKAGKTLFIDAIADGAGYQAKLFQEVVSPDGPFSNMDLADIRKWVESISFDGIYKVTAGNAFRAAALYIRELEQTGHRKTAFDEADAPKLWDLLNQEGVAEILQTDSEIESRVSKVAQMTGVRALCETIFCNEVRTAYHAEAGANLVIADARNPVAVFKRNSLLGDSPPGVRPDSIIPVYIDTPVRVAASRVGGDFEANVARIAGRRRDDRQRPEYPFETPSDLIEDPIRWLRQFPHPKTMDGIASPLHIHNDHTMSLEGVRATADMIAATAQDTAGLIYRSLQPDYVPPEEDEWLKRFESFDRTQNRS